MLTPIEDLLKSSGDECDSMNELPKDSEDKAVLVIDVEPKGPSDKRCSTVSGQECEKTTGEQNNTRSSHEQKLGETAVTTADKAVETV